MKNTYALKVIYTKDIHNIADYQKAINEARTLYFEGLKSVFDYCGGKLFKQRNGWSGKRGDIEYLCVKAPNKYEEKTL